MKIPSAHSWAAPVRATGMVRKRQEVRPVHHVQNHTGRVTLLPAGRRAAMLGHPSSLWTHWLHPRMPKASAQRAGPINKAHCNGNSAYIFLFWELRGLSPNFHIHVSVSDLYIPRIGPHISSSRKIRLIMEIYNSLTDT